MSCCTTGKNASRFIVFEPGLLKGGLFGATAYACWWELGDLANGILVFLADCRAPIYTEPVEPLESPR